MKYLLTLITALTISIGCISQNVLAYRAFELNLSMKGVDLHYASKWVECDVPVVVYGDDLKIQVYSKAPQIYSLKSYDYTYSRQLNADISTFSAIDGAGLSCTIIFVEYNNTENKRHIATMSINYPGCSWAYRLQADTQTDQP